MNTYKITVRDGSGSVLDSVVMQIAGGPGLWLAFDRISEKFRRENIGHDPAAVQATIERTCSCGEWNHAEYGDRCPSCPLDPAKVHELAVANPRPAIAGWLAGNEANGDAAEAAICRAALALQDQWHGLAAS